jgi:hypothetical protein
VDDRSNDQLRRAPHTSTGEWQSFEVRMRRRRLERLISRAEAAISRGQTQEVADALDEVRRLAPGSEQIATLEQALATSRSHDPVPAVADLDLPLAPTTVEISEPIDEAPDLSDIPPPVSTGRRQKVVVAVGSLMVAAAGLLVWSIYTAPEEQLRGLFPSLGDNRMAPPPDVSKGQPATPVDGQSSTPSARVRVETVEAAAVQPQTTDAAQEQPDTTVAPPPSTSGAPPPSSTMPNDALNLPTGTSGAPSASPPVSPQRADATAGAGAERTMPEPVADVPVAAPPETHADAVAAVAVASPPKPERTAAPSAAAEYVAVLDVLNRYAAAYSRLDAAAAQEVWPAVNRPALTRAFEGLASQRVALERCDVSVSPASAHAKCAGFATWSPKIGNGGAHTDACNWTFQLAKAGDDWQIVTARVQKR